MHQVRDPLMEPVEQSSKGCVCTYNRLISAASQESQCVTVMRADFRRQDGLRSIASIETYWCLLLIKLVINKIGTV